MNKHKGFIFCIDATLAMFILVLVLIMVAFLTGQSEVDSLSQVQLTRMAKDSLVSLDRDGVLQSQNASRINSTLEFLLHEGVKVHLKIDTYYYDNGSFFFYSQSEYGPDIPGNYTVYGARRDFFSARNNQASNYSIARAFIWQE